MAPTKFIWLGILLFTFITLFGCAGPQPQLGLNANFNPDTVKTGETTQLNIAVALNENKEYTPVVKIRAETASDEQYMTFSTKTWQLQKMRFKGDVQNNIINVAARASSSVSTFNVVIDLWANGTIVDSKILALKVTR